MILLRRGYAVFLLVLFTVFLGAIGIYGYLGLEAAGNEFKAQAEFLLYLAIVGISIVVITFFMAVGRTLSLYRELDKMIDLNKRGDFSPELSMRKLGPIGERITLLYFTLNSLNEKKGLKISALSSLTEFLAENTRVPVFVTDVRGAIVYVSTLFLESVDGSRADYLNQNVEILFPDVGYRDALLELDKKRTPVEIQQEKTFLTLAGINNRMNELSYVVWIFDKGYQLPNRPAQNEQPRDRTRRFRRLLSRNT